MQAYRDQRLKTKRETKAVKRQTYKANKQAKKLAKQQTTRSPKPKAKTRPIQMQRSPREHIQTLQQSNRALEKKLALLTGLLKQHAPAVAATI
jgi:hypothetical protein